MLFIGAEEEVFPARAGMIRGLNRKESMTIRIPRESGDDPQYVAQQIPGLTYSPRERG